MAVFQERVAKICQDAGKTCEYLKEILKNDVGYEICIEIVSQKSDILNERHSSFPMSSWIFKPDGK